MIGLDAHAVKLLEPGSLMVDGLTILLEGLGDDGCVSGAGGMRTLRGGIWPGHTRQGKCGSGMGITQNLPLQN